MPCPLLGGYTPSLFNSMEERSGDLEIGDSLGYGSLVLVQPCAVS